MAARLAGTIFAFGVLVLTAALLVPGLVDATNESQEQTVSLDTNETAILTEYLTVTVTDTNTIANTTENHTANVTLEQTKTLESTSGQINSSGETLVLDSDNVTVNPDSIENESATLSVEYPPMIGWSSGPRIFIENIGVVIALLAVMMIIAGFVWGMEI